MEFKGIFDPVLEKLLQEAIDKAMKFNVKVFSMNHLAHALLQDKRLLIAKPEITQKIIRVRDALSAYLRQAYSGNNDKPSEIKFSAEVVETLRVVKSMIEGNSKTHFHSDYLLSSLLLCSQVSLAVELLQKEGFHYRYVEDVIAEKEKGLSDRTKAFADLGEILFREGLTHTMIMKIKSSPAARGQIMVSILQACEQREE